MEQTTGYPDTCLHLYGGPLTITNCDFELTEGNGILLDNAPEIGGLTPLIDSCMVTLEDGVGIEVYYSDAEISDTGVEVTGTDPYNYGIDGGNASSSLDITGCFISVPAGTGIRSYIGGGIGFNTLDGVDVGVTYNASPDVYNCIVSDFDSYGFYLTAGTNPASYCLVDEETNGFYPSAGTGCEAEDPLYCDAGSGEFTLRVDSYGNPENNGTGYRIGAYDVACMYGTLARSASFAGAGILNMTATTTIPSGDSLSLGAGTTVKVAKGASVKLDVAGTLKANEAGVAVSFESAEASPAAGDWHSIWVSSGASAFLDNVAVQDAAYGIYLQSPDSARVTECYFENNSNNDIVVYNVTSSDYALIHLGYFNVGGGDGIALYGDCSGVTISNNTITGDATTGSGIRTQTSFSGTPTISSNTITGIDNGQCVYVDAGTPTFTNNTFQDSKYGMQVKGGTVSIGTASSSSDNYIHGNSADGIRCDGGSPGVRNSHIYSNYNGVYALNSGVPNLGDGAQNGNNSIYGNSHRHVVNRSASTVEARGNWWGSCAAPADTFFVGSVNRTAWLCSQPAGTERAVVEPVGPAKQLKMLGARPNPTRSASVITFDLEDGSAQIAVRVFDVSGRLVRSLGPEEVFTGRHEIHWDGRDDAGRAVRDGIYFVRVQANDNLHATTKVLVVR